MHRAAPKNSSQHYQAIHHTPDTKLLITDANPAPSDPGAISTTPTACSRMKAGSFSHGQHRRPDPHVLQGPAPQVGRLPERL